MKDFISQSMFTKCLLFLDEPLTNIVIRSVLKETLVLKASNDWTIQLLEIPSILQPAYRISLKITKLLSLNPAMKKSRNPSNLKKWVVSNWKTSLNLWLFMKWRNELRPSHVVLPGSKSIEIIRIKKPWNGGINRNNIL